MNKRLRWQVQDNRSFSLRFPAEFTSKSLLESSLPSPTSPLRPIPDQGLGKFTPPTALRPSLLSPPPLPTCPRPRALPTIQGHPRCPPAAGVAPSSLRPPAVCQQYESELTHRALKRRWPSVRAPSARTAARAASSVRFASPPPGLARPRAEARRVPSGLRPRLALACSAPPPPVHPAEPHRPRPFPILSPGASCCTSPRPPRDPLRSRQARATLSPQDGASRRRAILLPHVSGDLPDFCRETLTLGRRLGQRDGLQALSLY